MKKYFLLFALFFTSCGSVPQYTPAPVMAAGWTPIPTDTATIAAPTPTPLPTIDYRATDQAYQLAMEAQRNDMIKVQLAHDEEMMRQQVELASIGATQTFAPTEIALANTKNALTSGELTAVSIRATSTAQAPTLIVAMADAQEHAKHAKSDYIAFLFGIGFMCLFFLTGSIFFVRKSITLKRAEIMQSLHEGEELDYKPVPAQEVEYIPEEHNGINRRMEQRFAQVLLAMHELEPEDKAVNLLESFWIVRGARDKFQNRTEFLAVRDDWASDENGILLRRDPTITNSTFYVAKWDEVQLIANGERM